MSLKSVLSLQMLSCVYAFVAVVGSLYSANTLTSPANVIFRCLFGTVRQLFADITQTSRRVSQTTAA